MNVPDTVMSWTEALILAVVQGLTEFLPVSSSGHLALGALLLGRNVEDGQQAVFYFVLLHVGTMFSILVAFRKELWALTAAVRRGPDGATARRVLGLLAMATLPTALIGLAVKSVAEQAVNNPAHVGLGLLVTSALLASTVHMRRGVEAAPASTWMDELGEMHLGHAFAVGVTQGLAVFPGVSRSGSTIAAALWLKVPPLAAARFSLLASLPAVAGGFLLKARELTELPTTWAPQLVGLGLSFVIGLLAIRWLVVAVRGKGLAWFAAYTCLLGLACLCWGWFPGLIN